MPSKRRLQLTRTEMKLNMTILNYGLLKRSLIPRWLVGSPRLDLPTVGNYVTLCKHTIPSVSEVIAQILMLPMYWETFMLSSQKVCIAISTCSVLWFIFLCVKMIEFYYIFSTLCCTVALYMIHEHCPGIQVCNVFYFCLLCIVMLKSVYMSI